MKTLFIDTHLWNINIILFDDNKILRQESVTNKKNNSEYIFPTIEKVLGQDEFDSIIVVNGPGSFTGVRLGVTIAKTFAYTKNIPIRTITSLECMAVSSLNKNVAIFDNNGYYVGLFNDDMSLKEDYKYLTIDEFNKLDNVETDVTIDYEKVYEYVITKDVLDPHLVNPIYIKKIEAEKWFVKQKNQI